MSELHQRLRDGPCLLLDGGMGSMLLARGLPPGDAPERMNLERPEVVLEVHRDYVEAGSEAVHSNTFGGNPIRLLHFGLADRCAELNLRGVEIARRANPRFVLGDMGPTGEYLPPVGDGERERWAEGFRIQALAFLDAEVDGIHIETMGDLREARTALSVVRELSPEIPVLVSLTFERKKRGFFTIMGDPLLESLKQLLESGATVVGANCSIDSHDMRALAEEALEGLDGPLVFQPNAGLPLVRDGAVYYEQPPEAFASDLSSIVRAGVAAVGGCCGTDPRFIELLWKRLEPDQARARATARGRQHTVMKTHEDS